MTLQEIHLEINDDLASICDKVDGLNCSRVILVFPKGTTGFKKRLDMVLLQRHAQAVSIRIALVAKELAIRDEARMAGLSSFRSVKAARHAKWRATHPHRPDAIPPRYSTMELNTLHNMLPKNNQITLQPILLRVSLFAIGVAAVLSLAAYILMTTYSIL